MSTSSRKAGRTGGSAQAEPTIVYRGIKIAPVAGRRSKMAKAIREALRGKSRQIDGRPARG